MRFGSRAVVLLTGLVLLAGAVRAQAEEAHSVVYGFVQTDAGYFTTPPNPQWFDVQRPSRLPSFDNQYGKDGVNFFSVRQSRLGVKSYVPLSMGELRTTFEFDMFGTGADAGQTTIRPRVFYGEIGKFGAGQIASAFMDLDVFPNVLDYWGPNGMLFFRNPQLRWMPIQGKTRLTIALERPGASGDLGSYSDRVEVGGINPRFPVPDLSGNYHMGTKFGYIQIGGIVRRIDWEDLNATPTLDLSGGVTGWGGSVSSNINCGKSDVIRLQGVYGAGIENYFNDAPVDVGVKPDPTNTVTPLTGEALPVTGVVAYLDHTWSSKWTTSIGYSQVTVDNSVGQAPDAYHLGQYASANLLYSPDPKIMMGGEFGYEKRINNADGFDVDAVRIQFSFKYSFSSTIGGGQ